MSMIAPCQNLHMEFAKVEQALEAAKRQLDSYIQDGQNEKELDKIDGNLKKACEDYEKYCSTSQTLPDGRAIWLPDYIALLNLAQLNGIDVAIIVGNIPEDGLNPTSSRLIKLDLSELGIKELGMALSSLGRLQYLDLSDNDDLSSLGHSLNNLGSLKWLNLYGCAGLSSLANSLDNLGSLSGLYLSGCTGLSTLSNSLDNLGCLTSLTLSGCDGLSSLGNSLVNLQSLIRLYLNGCTRISSLGNSLDNLRSLTELHLLNCTGLKNKDKEVAELSEKLPNCKVFT